MTHPVLVVAVPERPFPYGLRFVIRALALVSMSAGATMGCESAANGSEEREVTPPARDAQELAEIGHVRGDPEAPVVVVEFSDFGCPHCATFALGTYPLIVSEYIEAGSVQWVYVPYFGGSFRNSDRAAEAAHCAGEQSPEHFHQMKDLIYETVLAWRRAPDPEALLLALAATFGPGTDGHGRNDGRASDPLDVDRFRTCLRNGDMRAALADARAIAVQRGVRGTPTFFVNGQMVVGSRSPEAFRLVLDEALRIHR